MYQRAISEILDECGSKLHKDNELTPEEITNLHGAAPKIFKRLYTIYGTEISSLLHIDEEVCMLIAGDKNSFRGLKTNLLFKSDESANQMLNRIVE